MVPACRSRSCPGSSHSWTSGTRWALSCRGEFLPAGDFSSFSRLLSAFSRVFALSSPGQLGEVSVFFVSVLVHSVQNVIVIWAGDPGLRWRDLPPFWAQFWQDFFLMSKTILILLSQCRILKIKRIFTRKLLMQEEQQMRGRGCVVITGDNWFILGSARQDPIEGVPFPPCQSSSVTQRNLL